MQRIQSHPIRIALLLAAGLASLAGAAGGQDDLVESGSSVVSLAGAPAVDAPLDRLVSLDVVDAPLGDVLREIDRQAALGLTFTPRVVPVDHLVSIRMRGTAREALVRVLEGTGVEPRATGTGSVLIVRIRPVVGPIVALIQSVLTGSVTDAATGEPLVGASVQVLGTSARTMTAEGGRFRLGDVPAGVHRVRAARVGYAPREREVTVVAGQAAQVDFALAAQAIQLEGVVAVGYGTQRRADVTGAVTTVEVDQIRSAPVTSVEQVLQGRAAGVQVVQNNGAPGGGLSVRIRGTNSISASSEPLYVIDGVPAFVGSSSRFASSNPLADLSPNDIESIEILKDASSAAIYGSRGANGVVLITTRRGTRGENRVQMQSSYGMQEVSRTIPLLDARQFAELYNEARANAGEQVAFTPDEISAMGPGTNWQEELFRPAAVQNHGVTISGGDEKTRYLVSGNLFDQEGIVIGSGFRRLSARLNLDREVSDRFRIGNSLTLSRTRSNSRLTDQAPTSGVIAGALELAPTAPVRDADGSYTLQNPLNVPIGNPVATALEVTDEQSSSRLVGSVFGELDIAEGLRFRSSVGGNASFGRQDYYAPTTTLDGRSVGGLAEVGASQASELVNDNILTYRRALREGHDLDLTGGFTLQTFHSENLTGRARQFATDITGSNNLGAGAQPVTPGSGVNEWTLPSYLARANYSLGGLYLLTLTGRYDGSSRFGANDKWGFFPSAALAWRLSDEAFLEPLEWLSDAKLRLSYGVTGNQEIGTYRSLARLAAQPYVYGTNTVIAYAPAGLAPNPDLKWESTRQFNAGLDVGLLDNRVTLTADVYAGTTSDLLLEIPLPKTSGFDTQLRNVGSVKNRGVELAVTTLNVERESLSWESSLNLAVNRNEVVELGGVERIFPAGARGSNNFEGGVTNIVQVGQPVGTFYGYRTNGIWQLGADPAASGDPHATFGEWRYVDSNGDGVISAEDRTLLGNAEPTFHGGLTNNLRFGPLTLNVFLQGNLGSRVVNATAVFLRSVTTSSNEHASSFGRWTPANPSNSVPRAYLNRTRRLLDRYVEDGSYLRLQNVTLGYRLPRGLVPGTEGARLYASGQNLHVWTRYSGYDPEVNSYGGDPSLRGVDMGMYPRSRVVNVGIDLNF